jgi:hypothetical protein
MKSKFVQVLFSALLTTGLVYTSLAAPAFAKGGGGPNNGGPNNGGPNNGGPNNGGPNNGGGSSSVLCNAGGVTAGATGFFSCAGPIAGNNRGPANSNLLNTLNNGTLSALGTQYFGTGSQAFDFTQYDWFDSTVSLGLDPSGSAGTSGNWSINQAINGPFAIAVKGGPDYSVYFFDSISQITGGGWDTLGITKGNGEAGPGLSHLDIYTTSQVSVPEPATIIGLGVVAAGMAAARRRRVAN